MAEPEVAQPASRAGVAYAVLAYASWGFFPIFWKQLRGVGPFEVLAHRVIWSCVFVGVLLAMQSRISAVFAAFGDPRTRRVLGASTALIAVNWFLFIWAVGSGRILEASLGYYVNPLVNVALGRLFLGERLTRPATVAVGLASVGVAVLAIGTGALPWVSLVLAGTFGLYGLCRKVAPVGPLVGLSFETLATTPIAMAGLAWLIVHDQAVTTSGASTRTWIFFILSGPATALPLLAFAEGARRLKYATLGIIQYLAPTLQFLCAVVLYGEVFTRSHAIAFAFIWCAVGMYVADSLRLGWARTPNARK